MIVQERAPTPREPGAHSTHAKELSYNCLEEPSPGPPIYFAQYSGAFLRDLLRPAHLALGCRRVKRRQVLPKRQPDLRSHGTQPGQWPAADNR